VWGVLLLAVLLAACDTDRARLTEDGRIPIRVYLLLISTEQVEFYEWAESTYEARNPGVDVMIEQFPGSSLKDFEIKLRLRYSSGQAPDVFHVHANVMAELAELGLLEPAPAFIDSLVEAEGRTEMIRQATVIDGVNYGMVSDVTPTVLYYNKDIFREVGLDPEQPPRTWEELITYAERTAQHDASGQVTRAGISLRKRGFKPGTAEKWLSFLYSAGGVAFNEAGTQARFNSPAGREALGFYETVLFDKKLDAINLEGDQQGFAQGKAAMFIREVHVIRWLKRNYPDLDFGVATLPRRDTSLSSGTPYVWNVSTQTAHPEASWRFVEFLMSPETRARYASIGGVIPVTRSVAARPAFRDDPYLSTFLEQDVKKVNLFPHAGRATGRLGAYIERFCYGRMSVEETLRRAEREVNALLRRNQDEEVVADGS
jgi:multiple sugar transport system substrate-binding protein